MTIQIETTHDRLQANCQYLRQIGEQAVGDRLSPRWTVSVTLVDDRYIRELNKTYLNRDAPTDVMAFPIDDRDTPQEDVDSILGDIYISLDRALEQSTEYGVPFQEEVARLLLHGLFHLLDYTHEEMHPLVENALREFSQKDMS